MGVTGVHLCLVELIEFDELFLQINAKKANIFYCDIIIPELIENCAVV